MVKISHLHQDIILSPPTDIADSNLRFGFLLMACLLCFGSYFVYNSPAALESELESRLGISLIDFNLLYSVYSLPNIIFPLLGGILLDKFGIKAIIFAASTLVTLGQCIFAFGVSIKSFYIALLGRAVFGCGGENLDMSQSVIVISWFTGRELSMAYTFSSCTSLVADVLNDNLNPFMCDSAGVLVPLWVGCIVCLASLVLSFFVLRLNQKRKRMMSGIEEDLSKEKFKLADLGKLGKMYWVLVFNITSIESCIYCFGFIASGCLQERFGYDLQTAGSVMSITFAITALTSPVFGLLVDRVGKRTVFNVVSCVLITSFHVAFMIIPDSKNSTLPIFAFLLFGAGYSMNLATSWPCVPLVVDEELIGSAYGMVFANGNLNLVIFPIIIGYIHESTVRQGGYFWISFFLAGLGTVGIFTGLWLHVNDKKNGGVLDCNKPFERKKSIERKNAYETKDEFTGLAN